MIKREENKYSMYQGITQVLEDQKETIAKIPAFALSMTDFNGVLEQISDRDKKYQTISKGATAAKDEAEDKLVEAVIAVSSALYVYGRRNKNDELKAVAKITPSSLKKMRDSDLLQKAKTIHENAVANQQSLPDFGVTQADVEDLKAKVTAFEEAFGSKESKVAESKSARKELGELFDEADELLYEELDNMIELVKDADPEFYNKYQSARVIKDL